jgi:PleD family two-component response regulator
MAKKRVMVIDDEEDFLVMIKMILDHAGNYEVMTLSSAKFIVSKAREFKPDVILIDMLMPEVKGVDACSMLSKDDVGCRIPVIVVSALEKDDDKLRAFKAGVVDYIVKPVTKALLVERIEKALKSK